MSMSAAATMAGMPEDTLQMAAMFDKVFSPEAEPSAEVSPVYEASLIKTKSRTGGKKPKRPRRTKEELADFLRRIKGILAEQIYGITIRHLFYLLETAKVIEKTEKAYNNLISHLSKWRKAGQIEYDEFVDGTRYWSGPTLYDDAEDALRECVQNYRRNLWSRQPFYVEIWCEKDAIRSILLRAAEPFGVPVFAAIGFASLTALHSAAQTFNRAIRAGKRPVVLYFGDHDPSGVSAQAKAEETLREKHGVAVEFRRLAVTAEQIAKFNLPTRPAKKTDSRAKNWKGDCVEVDAMSSEMLIQLTQEAIERMIDPWEWQQLKNVEDIERENMKQLVDAWKGRPRHE